MEERSARSSGEGHMCGIAGFLSPHGERSEDAAETARAMADALRHRGPDARGEWSDGDAGVALAHRRLAVLDLSPAGQQPMESHSGRFVIVYNGEIYNHLELRRELGRLPWRGHSDTETLLAAIERWGLPATLIRTVGMFAFGVWDRELRELSLARDRLGEKPLYYGVHGGAFLFASELKALRKHPLFQAVVDRTALAAYLRAGYVPAPLSIWQGIRKLPPGHTVRLGAGKSWWPLEPTAYWTLGEAVESGSRTPYRGSAAEAVDDFGVLLAGAVDRQMLADVPIGAFLSGGIDSSLIVAQMQALSSKPIKTFTIGFEQESYNEAVHARAVADRLGTDHTEAYVTSAEAQTVIPHLPSLYDEPFGDASAIPTHLVSVLARRDVTVTLSGDGGDELFGGYSRYGRTLELWQRLNRVPVLLRALAASCSRTLGSPAFQSLTNPMGSERLASVAARADTWRGILKADGLGSLYRTLLTQWPGPGGAHPTCYEEFAEMSDGDPLGYLTALDTMTYLPDDILVKVDRAAMAVGLETRVPLLDHGIVQFAWQLPPHFRVRGSETKWLMKQLLGRYLPPTMFQRPKMGFGAPVDSWIKGPLRDWAEELMSEAELSRDGWLDPRPIRRRWMQHQRGYQNWRDSLWTVLMLQAWRRAADV
jgi:asparagine synthase (glutamine-hydrolysing)